MNYADIKRIMIKKNFADGGLVAYGKNKQKFNVYSAGEVGALVAEQYDKGHIITLKDNKIMVTPFDKSAILFDKAYFIEKDDILSIKFNLFGKLKVEAINKRYNFAISKGMKDLKRILQIFGVGKEKIKISESENEQEE